MLTILGQPERFCDGISRRNFLRLGALAMGGLTLPQLIEAESQAGIRRSQKAIIMVYLSGGPSHLDMFDLKPNAPVEVRGEFRPIKTNVPGTEICEHMPRLAGLMDKLAIVRSLVDQVDDHNPHQCMTGRPERKEPPGGWPAIGSVIAKLIGCAEPGSPAFISFDRSLAKPGFLGLAHAPFSPSGPGKNDLVLNGLTLDRLADRKTLLASFDGFRRTADASGMMDGMDAFNQQAFGVITSNKLLKALDLKNEDVKVTERYKLSGRRGRSLDNFLMARRLVEAGVRCVTLSFGGWDTHGKNFESLRDQLPQLDQGLACLIEDLHERGLDKDVSLVVWGEFGRTPRINQDAGRDHWSRVGSVLLAGGGMKTGQVIGATDRLAGEAVERPVHVGEVFATLYQNMGIDVNKITLRDLAGRPQYLVDNGYQPMAELV